MKKAAVLASLCILVLSLASQASANLAQFAGKWQNTNPNTSGITALEVTVSGTNVKVHAWGKCHPTDCDWGTMQAYAYAPNAGGNLQATAQAISVVHKESFAERLLIIRPAGNELRVESYTRFTDSSGRTNYIGSEMFRKGAPAPQPAAEDCVSFNPATTTVQQIQGRWKVVDGSHWMFDFGANKAGADKALAVIKHYRMNKSCFVGRPNPDFAYLLVGNKPPVGAFQGEDCIKFNPANIKVQQVQGRWKIVDGTMWMYDFENRKNEADQALAIMKKYGFSQQCFVGRPNAPFQYLRK